VFGRCDFAFSLWHLDLQRCTYCIGVGQYFEIRSASNHNCDIEKATHFLYHSSKMKQRDSRAWLKLVAGLLPPIAIISALQLIAATTTTTFEYINFNDTAGLSMNGDAVNVSVCNEQPSSSTNNHLIPSLLHHHGAVGDLQAKFVTGTNAEGDQMVPDPSLQLLVHHHGNNNDSEGFYANKTINWTAAQFGHRDSYRDEDAELLISTSCGNSRLRLTSSHASKVGSAWYHQPVKVVREFIFH
jgi:hypothetical protein